MCKVPRQSPMVPHAQETARTSHSDVEPWRICILLFAVCALINLLSAWCSSKKACQPKAVSIGRVSLHIDKSNGLNPKLSISWLCQVYIINWRTATCFG